MPGTVAVAVGVAVMVGVLVGVLVGVEVEVTVGAFDGVGVMGGVRVAVLVAVGVALALGVAVLVGVFVRVGVAVALRVGVGVGVLVALGVGVGRPMMGLILALGLELLLERCGVYVERDLTGVDERALCLELIIADLGLVLAGLWIATGEPFNSRLGMAGAAGFVRASANVVYRKTNKHMKPGRQMFLREK